LVCPLPQLHLRRLIYIDPGVIIDRFILSTLAQYW